MIVYTCAEKQEDCSICSKKAIAFHTNDPIEAAKHSYENNSRMWISEITDKEYKTSKELIGKIEAVAQ